LGVFAKIDFQRNGTIFVERPVAQPPYPSMPEEESVREAMIGLESVHSILLSTPIISVKTSGGCA
jgi:hypothetical protein